MIRLLRFLPRQWWRLGAWKTWGTYVHWRLETYGVFFPDAKTLNRSTLTGLTRQLPSYLRWLKELDRLKSS